MTGIRMNTWEWILALIDCHGELIGNPCHYDDEQNHEVMEVVPESVPHEEIRAQTQVSISCHSTPCSPALHDETERPVAPRSRPEILLMVPDLLRFF